MKTIPSTPISTLNITKSICSILLVFTFGYSAAQIKGGVKGGMNFSTIKTSGDDVGSVKSITNYHFGVFLNTALGNNGIQFQPEVMYSRKGEDNLRVNYVEVPLVFMKNLGKILNIHFGPQFGFLTSSKVKIYDDSGNLINNDFDTKDFLKGNDISFVLGAGFDFTGWVHGRFEVCSWFNKL